ncbi:MAG: hypothetical protein P8N72_13210 [Flavimaricola sp.]|nr:hypothetical protein [Flavimaricola sp.]
MKEQSRSIGKVLGFFALLAVLMFGMFSFPNFLSSVDNYDQKVLAYSTPDGAEIPLPSTLFSRGQAWQLGIQGEFLADPSDWDGPKSIYIPFYVGSLKLFLNGVLLYDTSKISGQQHITSTRNAIVEVPLAERADVQSGTDPVRISFEVENDRGGLATISNIYIGQASVFDRPQLIHDLYYDVFRIGMLGAHSVLLALLCHAFLLRGLGSEALAPMLILLFFVAVSVGKLNQVAPGLLVLSQFAISFSPLVVLACLKLFLDIEAGDLDRGFSRKQIWAAVLLFLPIVMIVFGFIDIVKYNLFVAAPALLFGTFALSVLCISKFATSTRMDVGLWASCATLTWYSVLYDFLCRFGIFAVPANLASFALPIFIVVMSATFIRIVLSKKAELASANSAMKTALEAQSLALKEEFALSALLQKRATSVEEKARLTTELHDGVLTYLSIISALSEDGTDAKAAKINQLSRNAITEIRIILEARPSDTHSLKIALGALRGQLVDPLRHMGIEVEWSTEALLDHGVIEPKTLMDIIRIIQEAIHNAVIRGGCTYLSLVAKRNENDFTITIMNKGGQGFTEENKKGLGITNMMSRASSIGGNLEIEPYESGAILSLRIPNGNRTLESSLPAA